MNSLDRHRALWAACAGILGFMLSVFLFEPDPNILPERTEVVDVPRVAIPTKPCLLEFAALVGEPLAPPPPPAWLLARRRVAAETFCSFDWNHESLRRFRSALSDAGVRIDRVVAGDELAGTLAFYAALEPESRLFMEVADLAPAFSASSPDAARYEEVRHAAESVESRSAIVTSEASRPRRYEVRQQRPTVALITDDGHPIRISDLLEAFGRGVPPLQFFRRQLLRMQTTWFIAAANEFRRELARLVGASTVSVDLPDVTILYLADFWHVKEMRNSQRAAFYDPSVRSVFAKASGAERPAITDEFGLVADSLRIPGALLHEIMHYLYYRPEVRNSRFALEGEALAGGEMELRGLIAGQQATRSKSQVLSDLTNGDRSAQQQIIHGAVLASPMTDRQCVLLATIADGASDLTGQTLRRLLSYTSKDWDELSEWDSAFGHALAWAAYESRSGGTDGSLSALSGLAQRVSEGGGFTRVDDEELDREAAIVRGWLANQSKELLRCRENRAVLQVTRRLADGRKSSQ